LKPAIKNSAPVRQNYLVFGSPKIGQAEIDEVVDSIRSGWIGTGPKVARFEEMFRSYAGADYAVAMHSCTAALQISLLAAGIGSGDEVIVPAMTFCATANAVIHAGARPVFIDVDRETMNMAPETVEAAITPRTKAVIPVHMAGRPCDMGHIGKLARDHGLIVVEDAAHAIEGVSQGRKIGSISDATCFSFYVTKNLVTGEGGMLTTGRKDWAARAEMLALHGLSRGAWQRYSDDGFRHYQVLALGFKANMMDLQAAFGIHQLPRIEQYLKRREDIWRQYDAAFSDLPVYLPAAVREGDRHARHLYTLLLDLEALRVDRDSIMQALHRENIGTGIHFIALHLHPYYRDKFQLSPGQFPNATWISERTISLPLSAALSDDDVADVIEAVRKVLLYYRVKASSKDKGGAREWDRPLPACPDSHPAAQP